MLGLAEMIAASVIWCLTFWCRVACLGTSHLPIATSCMGGTCTGQFFLVAACPALPTDKQHGMCPACVCVRVCVCVVFVCAFLQPHFGARASAHIGKVRKRNRWPAAKVISTKLASPRRVSLRQAPKTRDDVYSIQDRVSDKAAPLRCQLSPETLDSGGGKVLPCPGKIRETAHRGQAGPGCSSVLELELTGSDIH